MYSIGQFARIGQVSANTLRYYDEIGLFSPAYVDPETQYRYYKKEQVDRFIEISELKQMGLSLTEIKQISQLNDNLFLKKILRKKLLTLDQELGEIRQQKQYIMQKLSSLEKGKVIVAEQQNYQIELCEKNEMTVISCRERTNIQNISNLIGRVFEKLHHSGLVAAGPHLTIYHDQEFNPEDTDLEVCIPVFMPSGDIKEDSNDTDLQKIPAGLFACTIHYGSFNLLGKAHAAVLDWINENKYGMIGPCLEIYHHFPGPAHKTFETEICYRVGKSTLQ